MSLPKTRLHLSSCQGNGTLWAKPVNSALLRTIDCRELRAGNTAARAIGKAIHTGLSTHQAVVLKHAIDTTQLPPLYGAMEALCAAQAEGLEAGQVGPSVGALRFAKHKDYLVPRYELRLDGNGQPSSLAEVTTCFPEMLVGGAHYLYEQLHTLDTCIKHVTRSLFSWQSRRAYQTLSFFYDEAWPQDKRDQDFTRVGEHQDGLGGTYILPANQAGLQINYRERWFDAHLPGAVLLITGHLWHRVMAWLNAPARCTAVYQP